VEERTLTVSQLGELVKTALSQVTPYGVWVEGEISGISTSRNGHAYFDLVEPAESSGARPVASIPVVLWRDTRERVNRLLQRHGDPIGMTNGVQVRIQGSLDFYPPSGRLQFRMSAIDPTYTLGKLAAQRDVLLAKLTVEGVLRANAACLVPLVPLRIALVTSLGSAAHGDMSKVFERSGLAFRIIEIDAAVQGRGSEIEVAGAIHTAIAAEVDLIVVARGGGSRTDLASFDHEFIARAIIESPIPVVTGIGHKLDRSVADEVAHTACITPTAAAQHVVSIVTAWLTLLDETQVGVVNLAGVALERSEAALVATVDQLSRNARHAGEIAQTQLVQASARVAIARRHALRDAERRLDAAHARTRALDPARALARGWSITRRADGSLLRSTGDANVDDVLVTLVVDGTLTSTITATNPTEDAS